MRKVGFELPSVPEAAEWTLSIRAAHEAIREAARSSRATGDLDGIVDYWGATALSLASEQGRVLKPNGASHVALCEALNDAEVKASEDALRRLDGDHVPTPEAPPLRKTRPARSGPDGKQLGNLFELYASTPGRHPKTIAQWRTLWTMWTCCLVSLRSCLGSWKWANGKLRRREARRREGCSVVLLVGLVIVIEPVHGARAEGHASRSPAAFSIVWCRLDSLRRGRDRLGHDGSWCLLVRFDIGWRPEVWSPCGS